MAVSEGSAKSVRARLRERVHSVLMARARRRLMRLPSHAQTGGPSKILILPADISDPTGSRGDEAMIQAVLDRVRASLPHAVVSVASSGNRFASSLTDQGVTEHILWKRPWKLTEVWEQAQHYDACIAIGADIMDGYYSSVTSLRLWMLAELFAHHKGPGRGIITGFSFNTTPTGPVQNYLTSPLSPNLVINVRDPISHRRFTALSAAPATLVADCAFMLQPAGGWEVEEADAWIAAQSAANRIVAGLNIHPMLSPTRDPGTLDALIASFAQAARALIDDNACSMLLIPHDYRGDVHGDVTLLQRLAASIDRPACVHVQAEPVSAAQIKHLAGQLDIVFSGRMHLAIAALGMGCPVVGITYQDKFDGLFLNHFELGSGSLLKGTEAINADRVTTLFVEAVRERATNRARVGDRLPAVSALSRSNLDPLFASNRPVTHG